MNTIQGKQHENENLIVFDGMQIWEVIKRFN